MSYSVLLEDMVRELGGCGRFKWATTFIVQASKAIAAWSMLAMAFNGQEPAFMCRRPEDTNGTLAEFDSVCEPENVTLCDDYVFSDEMKTVVDEWGLTCGKKWTVALITTIQMAGVLVGCFISGHLGDLIGRKPTFFLSLLILVIFNVVAYFSVNWQMYAVIRFILGAGIGFFLTVQVNVMTEFVSSRWRGRILAIPAWAVEAGLFALTAWGLKDWKNLHLATAAIGVPFLLTYCIVQESARWLVTRKRYDDVENVLNNIARINGKPAPDTSEVIKAAAKTDDEKSVNYSALDLFKSREMIKVTLGLLFMWMSVSYSYYGLTFGVASLAGNLYMNMFLMNVLEIPANVLLMYTVNSHLTSFSVIIDWPSDHVTQQDTKYKVENLVESLTVLSFLFTGLCGVIVGVVQYVDTPHRGTITNVFALACKMGIAVGWGSLMVYTTELYPTVVRTIAYGLHNTSARVGGMIAPQIVFLNDKIPGLMYFMSAAFMIISGLLCCLFPDTKDRILQDTIHTKAVEIKGITVDKVEKGENGKE